MFFFKSLASHFFLFFNVFFFNILTLSYYYLNTFFTKTLFFKNFFLLTGLIWQEGLLVDFLQKKITDNWTKKFLIYAAYLFNERFVFEKVTKFFLDLLIWPLHKFLVFELNNVSNMLVLNIFIFILIFIIFSLLSFLIFL